MVDIAALSVAVTADTSQLEAGLNKASQSVQGFGSQLSSIGTAAGMALAGVGVAAVAGLGSAIKLTADFEKQMSAVGAVAGASATEMEALTKAALQLGKDTSFSASEAATGIEELVKAGVSIENVLGGGARAALDLAAAGAISVGDAAEIASNALNVFGLKGADMAHVADVIAGAANASAIGVNDYKFSLAAAGAVAATVGISFESLSQAIAVMGNAGIKGSDAGTSLKTMLLNLQPTTKAQIAEFKALGLVTADGANQFFTAEGKAKSFAEIAGVLQKAMAGMTKQQQLASLEILFGADAIRAGAVLLDAGTEGFNNMAEAMSKVTAQAVAEERLNNLWGSVEKLKGSLETGAIILGSLFTPAIKTMVDQLTIGVNRSIEIIEILPDAWRTAGQAFEGAWEPSETLDPFINMVGEAAIALKTQLGPAIQAVSTFLTGTLGPAIQAIGQFFAEHTEFVIGFVTALGTILGMAAVQAVLAGIAAAIALLLSPIGLVTAAITLLVAAWIGNWGGIRDATLQAWAAMEPTFIALVDWLGAKIPPVLEWLANTGWPMVVTAGQAVGQFITGTLIPAFTQVVLWLGENIPPVVTWISDTGWPALVTAGQAVATFVTGTLIPGIIDLIDWLGPKLQPPIEWLTGTGWPGLQAAMQAAQRIGLLVVQFVRDLWTELEKRGIIDQVTVAFSNLLKVLEPIFNVLTLIVGVAAQVIAFFADLAIKGLESGAAVQVVATQIERFFAPIASGLDSLAKLIDMLRQLGNIPLPNLGGLFGSDSGGRTMALTGSGGSPDEQITRAALQRGYDPATAIALARHETGNYGSQLAKDANNIFSIKGQGPAGSVTMPAWEVVNGQNTTSNETFRRYNSIEESINDFFNLIETSPRYAGAVARKGDPSGFMQALQSGGYATDPNWATNVLRSRANVQVPNINASSMLGNITMTQAQWGTGMAGMTAAEAAAACGPYAAFLFAQATGRNPNPAEAEQLARLSGWTEAGMGGTGNFMNLLGRYGVNAVRDSTPTEMEAMNAGPLVGFSTPAHYFQSTGFDPATGKFNVGATGTYAGGSTMMSYDEIARLGGGIQDIIALAGQMGPAWSEASVSVGTSFGTIGVAATTAGEALVTTSTDSLGNVTRIYSDATGVIGATITNAAGVIVNQWGAAGTGAVAAAQAMTTGVTTETATMAAGVTANTNLMVSGALTSVTALGTGTLTTVQTMSGTTIATVTDMQGQVTSQYATLATGAQLSMDGLSAGVLTSTTNLGDGVMTTVQDMSGNYITTITDLSGNVTNQYVQLAADVTAATVEQSTNVQAETAAMGAAVLTSVTDMGDGIITITTDASGQIVATITDMAGNVTSQYESMGSDVTSSVSDMASTTTQEFKRAGDSARKAVEPINEFSDAMQNIPKPDLGGVISEWKKVTSAIKSAISEADRFKEHTGSKGGSGGKFARAAGGPVSGGSTYLVGEEGPELFSPSRSGHIISNDDLALPSVRSEGGMQTIVFVIQQPDGRTLEEWHVTGKDLATRRARS